MPIMRIRSSIIWQFEHKSSQAASAQLKCDVRWRELARDNRGDRPDWGLASFRLTRRALLTHVRYGHRRYRLRPWHPARRLGTPRRMPHPLFRPGGFGQRLRHLVVRHTAVSFHSAASRAKFPDAGASGLSSSLGNVVIAGRGRYRPARGANCLPRNRQGLKRCTHLPLVGAATYAQEMLRDLTWPNTMAIRPLDRSAPP